MAMRRAAQISGAVRHLVALRCATPTVGDDRERRRLERVQRELLLQIGVGVPKRRAAELLGVSVSGLEKAIASGSLPTVRRPGTSRTEIDTEALVAVAVEVTRLRESGVTRGALAEALRRVRPTKLRPNESARELRESYARTTPLGRLREAAELSFVTTTLSSRRKARAIV